MDLTNRDINLFNLDDDLPFTIIDGELVPVEPITFDEFLGLINNERGQIK